MRLTAFAAFLSLILLNSVSLFSSSSFFGDFRSSLFTEFSLTGSDFFSSSSLCSGSVTVGVGGGMVSGEGVLVTGRSDSSFGEEDFGSDEAAANMKGLIRRNRSRG